MIKTPKNGTIWQAPNGLQAVVQWVSCDRWGLLSVPIAATTHRGTSSIFISDPDGSGRLFYTAAELDARMNGWTALSDSALAVVQRLR